MIIIPRQCLWCYHRILLWTVKCELGKLQLTQYNQHTTDGELSITEHSHMQTRHSFLVYILLHSTAVAVECSYNNNIIIIPRHCLWCCHHGRAIVRVHWCDESEEWDGDGADVRGRSWVTAVLSSEVLAWLTTKLLRVLVCRRIDDCSSLPYCIPRNCAVFAYDSVQW